MSIPDILDSIPESGIRKLFELASKQKDVISLGIGEPDFDTPQHIKEYALEALQKGMTHYTPNNGLKILRDEISEKLKKENGIIADPDKNIIVTVGGNQAFLLALSTFVRPGEEVIIPSPYFVTHAAAARLVGGTVVEVKTCIENDFRVDPEDLRRSITRKTRCIIISTPNNPTGSVLTRKDLEEIADIAVEYGIRIVSDEVYEKLVYDGAEHVSIASLNGMSEYTITVNSFSKAYAMTGWRLGYVVADPATVAKMTKFQMYLAACPVSFVQYAAAKALRDPRSRAATESMRQEYQRRRDYLYKRLSEIDSFVVNKPMGAFYIFPKVDFVDDDKFAERLLVEGKVVVVPGSAFGTYGRGHVRLCYATSLSNIEEAMNRIERFVQSIRHGS
ncbi:MAG: pyridoxal phosphate-dependent aminotransferase [Candidatus Methanomethyliales bacterium]|nr:pyridoxal phosphate-dependent aminotransferase [Candidatus Methanomethylicales archaeon]